MGLLGQQAHRLDNSSRANRCNCISPALAFRALADHLYKRADEAKKKLVPCSYVQAPLRNWGLVQAGVRNTVSHERPCDRIACP